MHSVADHGPFAADIFVGKAQQSGTNWDLQAVATLRRTWTRCGWRKVRLKISVVHHSLRAHSDLIKSHLRMKIQQHDKPCLYQARWFSWKYLVMNGGEVTI